MMYDDTQMFQWHMTQNNDMMDNILQRIQLMNDKHNHYHDMYSEYRSNFIKMQLLEQQMKCLDSRIHELECHLHANRKRKRI